MSETDKRQPFYPRFNEDSIPFQQRPTCSIKQACEATGIRRSMLYEMMADGRLEYTKVGARRLVRVDSLLRLVAPKASGAAVA